jgi:DNA-binding response OmpR family regulator
VFCPSVLILIEDAFYLSTLVENFQRAQYRVVSAAFPVQVLELLRNDSFDLLILDISSPGMADGRFLAEVRCISNSIPIITITENPCLETALHALRYKAHDYLEKKISFDDLFFRIHEILQESQRGSDRIVILDQMQALIDSLRSSDGKDKLPGGIPVMNIYDGSATSFSRGLYAVNMNTREVTFGEKSVVLSQTELNYWVALLRHEPEVISYKLLVKEAQSYELGEREAVNLARWHIHGLRRIFQTEWGMAPIQTVRGIGYRVIA